MKPTYTTRQRKIAAARKKAEARIERVALARFRSGWRELYPIIRQIEKTDDPQRNRERQFWERWQREFDRALREAWERGAAEIAAIEADWFYARGGHELDFDPASIVAALEAEIGAKITGLDLVGTTRENVERIISEWYNTDAGMAALVEQLQVWFGPDRARLIGITETTRIASAVTSEAMRQADVHGWRWANRQDTHVCDECEALGDPDIIYSDDDPMPPEHPGCRCGPAPVVGEDGEE